MRKNAWFGVVICTVAVLFGILVAGLALVGLKTLFGIEDETERLSALH